MQKTQRGKIRNRIALDIVEEKLQLVLPTTARTWPASGIGGVAPRAGRTWPAPSLGNFLEVVGRWMAGPKCQTSSCIHGYLHSTQCCIPEVLALVLISSFVGATTPENRTAKPGSFLNGPTI